MDFNPYSPTVFLIRRVLSRTPSGQTANSTRPPAAELLAAVSYGTVEWSVSVRADGLDAHEIRAAWTAKTEKAILASSRVMIIRDR